MIVLENMKDKKIQATAVINKTFQIFKKEQIKPKLSRRKEIIKFRVKIKEMEKK